MAVCGRQQPPIRGRGAKRYAARRSLSAPKGSPAWEPFGAKRLRLAVEPLGALPACVCRQARSSPFFFFDFLKKNWKQNMHEIHEDFNKFYSISHSFSSTIDPTLSSQSTSKFLKIPNPRAHSHKLKECNIKLPLRSLGSPLPPPPPLFPSWSPCVLHFPQSFASPPPQVRSSANEIDP